jgi:hypothetical protein
VQDFQEYVVEFPDAASETFRFCLYREFELSNVVPARGQGQRLEDRKPEGKMSPS